MFAPGLMLILGSAMAILVPILLIGRMNRQLLLAPGVFRALPAVTVWDYSRRLEPVSFAIRDQFGTLNAGLAEAISGSEAVKANVQERYEWLKFTGDARKFRDYYVKQGEIQAVYLPALAFTVAWAGALLQGAAPPAGGHAEPGAGRRVPGAGGHAALPHLHRHLHLQRVQLGMAGSRRILGTMNTETGLDENPAGVARPIRGEVAFAAVSFGYNGGPAERAGRISVMERRDQRGGGPRRAAGPRRPLCDAVQHVLPASVIGIHRASRRLIR